MTHPKRKTSKERRNTRRGHIKAEVPTLAVCSNCSATVKYHTVCPECGHYRGKLVIEKKVAT